MEVVQLFQCSSNYNERLSQTHSVQSTSVGNSWILFHNYVAYLYCKCKMNQNLNHLSNTISCHSEPNYQPPQTLVNKLLIYTILIDQFQLYIIKVSGRDVHSLFIYLLTYFFVQSACCFGKRQLHCIHVNFQLFQKIGQLLQPEPSCLKHDQGLGLKFVSIFSQKNIYFLLPKKLTTIYVDKFE